MRAFTRFGIHPDRSSVLLYYFIWDKKAESCTFGSFWREKKSENCFYGFLVHADAIVANIEYDVEKILLILHLYYFFFYNHQILVLIVHVNQIEVYPILMPIDILLTNLGFYTCNA